MGLPPTMPGSLSISRISETAERARPPNPLKPTRAFHRTFAFVASNRLVSSGTTPGGPDLASVMSNEPEKLLVSILDPNREVPPQFTAWTAETRSGETYTGLLARESETLVTLRTVGGAETTLSRRDPAVWRPEGRSLMPGGLDADLAPEDPAALLSFLSPP